MLRRVICGAGGLICGAAVLAETVHLKVAGSGPLLVAAAVAILAAMALSALWRSWVLAGHAIDNAVASVADHPAEVER